MTTSEALRRLTPLIRARAAGTGDDVRATDRLEQDLRMDSMAVVNLLQDIEDSFGLVIPDERLAEVYTVEDLVGIVCGAPRAEERAA